MVNNFPNLQYWRTLAVVFFCALGFAAYEISQRLVELGVVSLDTFWWPVVISSFAISIVGLFFVWTSWFKEITTWFSKRCYGNILNNEIVSWGIFIVLSLGFSIWVVFKGYIVLNGFFVRIFVFIVIAIIGSILLFPQKSFDNWKVGFASLFLISTSIYRVMTYVPDFSLSPFSLHWSEGSRFYYGSLFFSEGIYGQSLPLSVLHPSRYMLLSIPFIIPDLPIWVHRLWQVLLWICLGWIAAFSLSRRLNIKNTILSILFASWMFLFLNIGPVYYHLLLCVIIIFWGVDFKKPIRTLLILIVASVWAGLSRINWIPVPYFLVVTLYFLECPWSINDKWKYLLQPVIWAIGIFFGYFAYRGYIHWSGNDIHQFSSSFTSDLLWYRLWPNSTFPLGILPGTLLVSIPLWISLYLRFKNTYKWRNPIKLLGYLGMVLALFVGGIVVSVKIGGGNNLHNMDAYFVLLMTMAGYVFWRRDVFDRNPSESIKNISPSGWIVALLISIPILLTLRSHNMFIYSDLQNDQKSLENLNQIILEAAESGGEILFISERQLQVFNQIPDIPMVADYEKLELMEMAMSNNKAYLNRFYQDVKKQRFALIVNDTIQFRDKNEFKVFFEEDDVWDDRILRPLVKYYQYGPFEDRMNITILTPKNK